LDTTIDRYLSVRHYSLEICDALETEDYVVQPVEEVSPPKWHLAHTTWFFEEMVLVPYLPNYSRFNDDYSLLFNSYYKGAGTHWIQGKRGHLSRPTVQEVLDYRSYVDTHIDRLLSEISLSETARFQMETGLQHEQQHQELMFMDIKFILGVNPTPPRYCNTPLAPAKKQAEGWATFKENRYEIGHSKATFSYDNERPRHTTFLQRFTISENTVTNGDFIEFIEDNGYATSQHWLSQGWDWANERNISCPLYWKKMDEDWQEFTLHGYQLLDPFAPVVHISYFEANAYANWKGYRLPTEQESELYLNQSPKEEPTKIQQFHPIQSRSPVNQVWWWTQSHYSPYPGYKAFDGILGEYNGKFMCNQFVLKGGCIVTPPKHFRSTYRNFYFPHQRWMFSGIRLAKDCK